MDNRTGQAVRFTGTGPGFVVGKSRRNTWLLSSQGSHRLSILSVVPSVARLGGVVSVASASAPRFGTPKPSLSNPRSYRISGATDTDLGGAL